MFELTAAQLRSRIAERIFAGEMPEGSSIRQESLASEYQVSRIPVRDALLLLQADGLVTIDPARRAFVTRLTPQEVSEIFEIREMLESDIIARSVPRLTESSLVTAASIHSALGIEKDESRRQRLDLDFHLCLYGPAMRPTQLQIIRRLRAQVMRHERVQRALIGNTPAFQAEHRRILEACERRDPKAASAAVTAHMQSALKIVLASGEVSNRSRSRRRSTRKTETRRT